MTWQPIETAPKDGTRMLFGWQNGGVVLGFRYRDTWTADGSLQRNLTPTHWMPLPPPPE